MKETTPTAQAQTAAATHPAEYEHIDAASIAEQLPALVAFVDVGQRYRYVNLAYEQFFARRRTEILTMTVAEVTGAEHYSIAEQYIERALRGEHVTFGSALRRADGSVRDAEVAYTPHRDAAGIVDGFTSLVRDVTELTYMTEARARLAAIVDSSDDAIVSKTLQGVITSWNRAAERMFGYTAAEAVGQHITLIIPPEKKWEEDEVLARLRRGEKIDHFETERRTKDGRPVYVSLTVSPVRNAAGEIIGASKVAHDITERRRSEEALRATEQYRRTVLDSMPECVKVLDRNGIVMHMNSAGLAMVEASSPDDIVGKCIYGVIVEQDRDAFRAINENVFAGGPGGGLEFGILGLKGSERIFETNVVPLRGGRDDVIGALSVTRNITARKQAERRDAFLVRLDDETRPLSDPNQVIETASRLVAQHLGADRCAWAEVDSGEQTLQIAGSYAENVQGILGRYDLAAFGTEFVRRMRAAETYVAEDVESELPGQQALETYRALHIRGVVAVPLMKSGRLVAAMAVHQSAPRKWRQDEIDLVGVVANRCWESIERTRVARELRDSEQQFRTLANTIPNLAWMAHPDGHIFWYNRRWYEYTGTTPEQMEGWGWQTVHDPAVLASVLERWNHSIATGEPFEMVFPLRGADGRFRAFLTRVEPIRDDRGRVTRWFGSNTDVTTQQEAELREKRARETAEILNRIGPVLAAELDPDRLAQKITDIATEAVRAQFGALFRSVHDRAGDWRLLQTLSGAPPDAVAGLPPPRITPGLVAPTFDGEGAVRSADVAREPRFSQIEAYFGMPEGHPPVRSYLAVPVKSRTGAVVGGLFFGHSEPQVFTDESERIATGIAAQAAIALDNASLFEETRSSSEALRRSNESLRQVNEDLNQFAYSASHDLREPLRVVSIYTQFLSRKLGPGLDEEGRRFMEYILKATSRLEALIRDLLAYTKAAEAGDPQTELSDTDRALKHAISNLSAAIEEAGAKVTVTGDRLPKLRVAEVHITQLLQNLVGNAVKYRSDKSPDIRIGAVRRGSYWEFFIADNGIGIGEEYKEHIFGIFKRLHNNDEYSGTGIGLAICQRIVQRYGGRIWVESQPGGGSTFYFTLPAAE